MSGKHEISDEAFNAILQHLALSGDINTTSRSDFRKEASHDSGLAVAVLAIRFEGRVTLSSEVSRPCVDGKPIAEKPTTRFFVHNPVEFGGE